MCGRPANRLLGERTGVNILIASPSLGSSEPSKNQGTGSPLTQTIPFGFLDTGREKGTTQPERQTEDTQHDI